MKNILILLIISLSIFSLNAQDNIYGKNYDLIKKEQNKLLKKNSVKKIAITSYQYISNSPRKTSKKIIKLNKTGAIKNSIYKDFQEKETYSYTYNQYNLLEKVEKKIKKGKYGFYKPSLIGRVFKHFAPNKFYFTYDTKNRLIKKKSCKDKTQCKTEHIKYIDKKIFTSKQGIKGDLENRKIWERNNDLEIELTISKFNTIEFKSVITYNRDSVKLKEEHFRKDTLVYREINKVENNRIVQSIKSNYYKRPTLKVMQKSVHIEYYIYNEELKLQTIIHVNNNKKEWKQRFIYDKNGLLTAIKNYKNKKLTFTNLYKYNMW